MKNDKTETVAAQFTELARSGKTGEAVEYFFSEAALDGPPPATRASADGLRTPPMNEFYKGVKDK